MSARPNFLTTPGVWIRAARTSESQVDQACAVHHNVRPATRTERMAGVMLAVALGITGAALLAHWAAS